MDQLICKLCAGSPEIDLYEIKLLDEQKKSLNKINNIKTDICIGREVEQLIKKGVITYGCCCGHGEKYPTCLVNIQSKEILNDLEYELYEVSDMHTKDGIYEITLKTDIQCELRKVLSSKIFRYLEGALNENYL